MLRVLLLLIISLRLTMPAYAEPLQGGVEQNRTLEKWEEEVLPKIKVGAVWNDNLLPRQRTDEVWFFVPPWKAGELQGETATEYEVKDGQLRFKGIHKNSFDLLSGQQRDAQGGIWHCARFPNVSTVETDDKMVTVIGLASTHLRRTPNEEFVRERSIEIARSKETNKILSVRELQSRAKWLPQPDGSLLFIQQTLGENNVPTREGRVIVHRVAPFQRVNSLPDGFDLVASFRRFLISQGMRDLIPRN